METAAGSLKTVAELIHLAVAPIFLLTGVATTLTVFAGRLARIVDRGRALESRAKPADRDELPLLERRAHLIYRALTMGVMAAILVCLLMTLAFAGAMLASPFPGLPLVICGVLKIVYDVALLYSFRHIKPPEEQGPG